MEIRLQLQMRIVDTQQVIGFEQRVTLQEGNQLREVILALEKMNKVTIRALIKKLED